MLTQYPVSLFGALKLFAFFGFEGVNPILSGPVSVADLAERDACDTAEALIRQSHALIE